MTLPLTPDMLAGAYEYLRTTPPFRSWKLPEADEVEFRVTNDATTRGWHEDNPHQILAISSSLVGHSSTLLETLAHEMCHMRQSLKKWRDHHGESFQRLAKQVCRYHGFDPKEF